MKMLLKLLTAQTPTLILTGRRLTGQSVSGKMRPILEVKNLSTHFATQSGIVRAVDGVDLAVNEGDTLVGNSGIEEGEFCHPF